MNETEFLGEIKKIKKYPWYYQDKYCTKHEQDIDSFLYDNLIRGNIPLSSFLRAIKIKEEPILFMNYDLTKKEERQKFVKRANALLRNKRTNICLIDESDRTLNQNSYLHVLCRILATETGVTEEYAKDVYFKQLANHDIFITTTKDELSGKCITYQRSTRDLTIDEMRKAITRFIAWAAENGYQLPEASIADDGTWSFVSIQDANAFHQAQILTSKNELYL